MGIDASIYSQIQAPKENNLLGQYAQMQQIQGAQNQNRLADLMYGEKQHDIGADRAAAGLLSRGENVGEGLARQGFGKQSIAYTKSQQDALKQRGDIDKTQAEILDKSLGQYRSVIGQVSSPEMAGQYASAMYDDPVLGKFASRFGTKEESMQRNMDAFAKDPRAWMQGAAGMSADKLIEMFKGKRQDTNLGNESRGQTINAYGEVVPGSTTTTPILQSADNLATTRQSGLNNAATVAATERGQNLIDARKREELVGADNAFSPDAIKNAAARYNIDGTLPPMGMGKAGSAGRAAILNEAANQAGVSGVSPDDQRIAQIGNKANTAALSKIQQSQTMVGAFERNFTKNADLALEQSKKVDRTGVPLANKWINAGKRAIQGDPELSAYDAVIKSTSNEYAKIISGSMGNTVLAEGEIKKVESLLNSAQTPAQVEAVIKMMKLETQNRMKGFDEEKASLRGSMGRRSPVKAADAPAANIDALLNKYK